MGNKTKIAQRCVSSVVIFVDDAKFNIAGSFKIITRTYLHEECDPFSACSGHARAEFCQSPP